MYLYFLSLWYKEMKSFPVKGRDLLFHIVNTIIAKVPASEKARASAAVALVFNSGKILATAQEKLNPI